MHLENILPSYFGDIKGQGPLKTKYAISLVFIG